MAPNQNQPNAHQALSIADALALAMQHHQSGNLPQAEALYRQILATDPHHPDALYLLGILAQQAGQPTQALSTLKQLTRRQPKLGQAWCALGGVQRDLGQLAQSLKSLRKALSIAPQDAESRMSLGITLGAMQRLPEAKAAFDRCLQIEPNHAEAHNNLGLIQQQQGETEKALASFQRAIELQPDMVAAMNNLGSVLHAQGALEEARQWLEKALAIQPDHGDALRNTGHLLRDMGHDDEAQSRYQQALDLYPQWPEPHDDLGRLHQKMKRFDQAIACYQEVLSRQPDHTEAHHNLSVLFTHLGQLDQALNHAQQAAEHSGLFRRWKNLVNLMLLHPDTDHQPLYATCREASRRAVIKPKRKAARPPSPSGRVRIGYLSSDFRDHPVGRNVLPLITHHDRNSFEIFCYAEPRQQDDITRQFKELADHWRPIQNLSDQEVARQITSDGIHMMIYLGGMFDENRFTIAALRPAPLQLSFHGGSTTGLDAMDYWITDSTLHPPNQSREQFSESLLRLPVFYNYPPLAETPDVTPLPALERGFITFASLNNPDKINDAVMAAWGKILSQLPKARLLLKYRDQLAIPTLKMNLLARFEAQGISPDRLTLLSGHEDHATHLAHYQQADIALDTFPCTGATTTFQALWMGVPVVTLLGARFIGRMAGDIVVHAGVTELAELAVETPAEYVSRAVALAEDLPRLAGLRHHLRAALCASPICDGPTYARQMEQALHTIWNQRENQA
ncbi:MAG: tetratricopeptide repeat protein [Magnetococcales bacterium]|nr:tetratricopeptide repeat protein [Magnetococcales bacterium]